MFVARTAVVMVNVRLVRLLTYLPFAAIDTVTLHLPDAFVVRVVLFNEQLPDTFHVFIPDEFDVARVDTLTDVDAVRLVTLQVTVGAVPLAAWAEPTPDASRTPMVSTKRPSLRGKWSR